MSEIFKNSGHNVTIFGSARTTQDNLYYQKAKELGFKLSQNNINVITGGGPGIMRAGNEGACEAKTSHSIGLSIELPFEQANILYTTKDMTFNYFFSRKFALVKYSRACVVFPGGYGTMDELFEVLTLSQTNMLKNGGCRVFLVGTEYWKDLMSFIQGTLVRENMIKKEDIDLITFSDDIEFITNEIKNLLLLN
jgi:uncharacterized protein (TIGR00730 family)